MKSFYFVLIQYIILTGIFLLCGFFYPILPFLDELNTQKIFFVRILASYCYYKSEYNITARVIYFIMVILLSLIILFRNPSELNSFFKQNMFIQSFLYYFFWLYAIRDNFIQIEGLNELFWIQLFWIFGFLLVFFICFKIFEKYKKKTENVNQNKILPPRIRFECPRCKKEYNSKVYYCIHCHNDILL